MSGDVINTSATRLNELLTKERALDAFVGSSILLLFPLLVPCASSSPFLSEKLLVGIESGIAIIGFLLLISFVPWLLRKSSNAGVSEHSSWAKSIEDGLLHILFFTLPFISVALFFATAQIVHVPLSLYTISNIGIILAGVAMVVIAFISLIRCKNESINNTGKIICFFAAICISVGASTLIMGTMQNSLLLQTISVFCFSSPVFLVALVLLFNMVCGCCRKLESNIFEKEHVENKTDTPNSSKKTLGIHVRKLFLIPEGESINKPYKY